MPAKVGRSTKPEREGEHVLGRVKGIDYADRKRNLELPRDWFLETRSHDDEKLLEVWQLGVSQSGGLMPARSRTRSSIARPAARSGGGS